MKKKSMKIVALVAAVLPMLMLGSCGEIESPVIEEREYTPDEEYIRGAWMIFDSEGNMVDTKYGTILDKSTPTIRYIGVENLDEAGEHFLKVLCPPHKEVSKEGDNKIIVSLNDSMGVEKNKLIFSVVNDDATLACVTFEKPIGIENIITELRYTVKRSFVDMAIGGGCPFQEGRIYYHGGHNYLCMRTPTNDGKYGLLVCDPEDYHQIDTNTEDGSKEETANYPDAGVFAEIQDILKKQTTSLFWQRLAATTSKNKPSDTDASFSVSSVPEFKKRIYWTSTVPNDNEEIRTWSLVNGCQGDLEPSFLPSWVPFISDPPTYRNVLIAYAFFYTTTIIDNFLDRPGSWYIFKLITPYTDDDDLDLDIYDSMPLVESFERNELVEKASGNIPMQ